VLVTSNQANIAASRLARGHLWSRRATSMVLISLGAWRKGTTRVTWAPSTPSLASGLRSRPSPTAPGMHQLLFVPKLSSCSHTAFTRGLICRHSLLVTCLAFLSHTYQTFHACLPVSMLFDACSWPLAESLFVDRTLIALALPGVCELYIQICQIPLSCRPAFMQASHKMLRLFMFPS